MSPALPSPMQLDVPPRPAPFDVAFDRLIGHEGGYVNNPNDPGGETKWGISKRSYPDLDIANLTRDDARAIYLTDFWQRTHADEYPFALAFAAFDFAAHSGIDTAVRYLQRALGVADDGHWGPVTRAAAQNTATYPLEQAKAAMRLYSGRLDFMTRRANWSDAGKGWARRIATDLAYAADDV